MFGQEDCYRRKATLTRFFVTFVRHVLPKDEAACGKSTVAVYELLAVTVGRAALGQTCMFARTVALAVGQLDNQHPSGTRIRAGRLICQSDQSVQSWYGGESSSAESRALHLCDVRLMKVPAGNKASP